MKFVLLALGCLSVFWLKAQPQLTIDSNTYHCGLIKTGIYKRVVSFKNTGDQPLVLINVKSSKGNCIVNYSREPMEPGAESRLTFVMSAAYVGRFTASVTIHWNHPEYSSYGDGREHLQFKGTVIHHRTSVRLNQEAFTLNKMEFFDMDTLRFEVYNTGDQDLYIGRTNHPECDLLYTHQEVAEQSKSYSRAGCKPGDTIHIEMVFCNLLGKVGAFSKNISFAYNNKDSFSITVHMNYSSGPGKALIAVGNERYKYQDDLLVEKAEYSGAMCMRTYSYKGFRLREVTFHYQTMRLPYSDRYHNGRILDN